MLVKFRSTPLVLVAVVGLLLSLVACGDDDGSQSDAGAGKGGRDGGTGGTGGASIEPLPDMTAGKACEEDEDCGAGTCATMLAARFGATGMAAPGGYCTASCMTNGDCGEGGTCFGAFAGIAGTIAPVAGQCLAVCDEASDCRTGYRCVTALGVPVAADGGVSTPGAAGLLGSPTCQPAPATDQLADEIVGSACAADEECGDGRCLRMSGQTAYPEGYCSGRCLEDADCGSNGVCALGIAGGVGTCYLRCSDDGDCGRAGYRCRMSGVATQCLPGPKPLPDNIVGNACTSEADCGGGPMTCGTRLGMRTATGGYCTQRCANSSDCGAGGQCVGARGGTTASGNCYKTCAAATDCRDGYQCAATTGGASNSSVCSVVPPPPVDEDAGTP